ncbi:MAG: arginine N-succinyltransferase [Pseudomonadota bacterium]
MSPADFSFVVRAVGLEDVDGLMGLARKTGGGMTNLPPDEEAIRERVESAAAHFNADIKKPGSEYYMLVMEDLSDGAVVGTSALFGKIGMEAGYYLYKVGCLIHASREADRRVEQDVLYLTNDYTGLSEVGGLFLDLERRRPGVGKFLARSRYMFMGAFRDRFEDKVIAELRGVQNKDGESPFWNAIGRKFFDMDFHFADLYNAKKGNQFIADLMPKYPVYATLLPTDAQNAIGAVREDSKPAHHMLVKENFRYDGYVDIFDAGPALVAFTDDLKAVIERRAARVEVGDIAAGGTPCIVSSGRSPAAFRCLRTIAFVKDGVLGLSADAAEALRLCAGDEAFWIKA